MEVEGIFLIMIKLKLIDVVIVRKIVVLRNLKRNNLRFKEIM